MDIRENILKDYRGLVEEWLRNEDVKLWTSFDESTIFFEEYETDIEGSIKISFKETMGKPDIVEFKLYTEHNCKDEIVYGFDEFMKWFRMTFRGKAESRAKALIERMKETTEELDEMFKELSKKEGK